MWLRLFLPFFRINTNRFRKNGTFNLRFLPLFLLGIAICIALYFISYLAVDYFHAQSELGIILSVKIFQMIWITIFAMLMFSTMITSVSTLYLSKDNEILVAAPVSLSELYRMRFITTALNTGWMVLVFSLPVFAAFGTVFQASVSYWLLLLVSVPATALTASGSAQLFIILLVYLFPAKRTKDIIFYLTLCFGIFLYLIFRLMRPEDLVNPEKYGQFIEYLSAISNPAGPWLPAGWTSNLLITIILDHTVDWLLLGLILLTPLIIYFFGEILMTKLFFRGYSKSQESFGGLRTFRSIAYPNQAWLWVFRKEWLFFLRDSKEWSQFFMIGALVVVYLYNFKVLPLDRTFGTVYVANLISFGNIGLTGFLAASLAARFVYPTIGAEGGAFYLLRSSALTPARYLLYKYLFYVGPFTGLVLILIGVSNHFLQIDGPMWWISLICAVIICWTVVAMALGFGALFADFTAENRAASMGPGAIFFLFCSIAYILILLLLGFSPTYRLMRGWFIHNSLALMDAILIVLWAGGSLAMSLALGLLILNKGRKSLLPK